MQTLHLAASLAELLDRLRARPDSLLLAGGTDLFPQLRQRPEDERPLLGLERVPELARIEPLPAGGLAIGAAVSFARILTHPSLVAYPLLVQAAATVGGPAIRTMASIGGNLCTASPAGDALPPLYLLDAQVELQGAGGVRTLPIAEFITGPRRTALGPGEVLTRILLPPPGPWQLQRYIKVGRRRSLAIAVVSLAAALDWDRAGTLTDARLAWGSVGPRVIRCPQAEAQLRGGPLTGERLAAAAALARQAVQPIDDLRASAAYRRALAGNLLLGLAD